MTTVSNVSTLTVTPVSGGAVQAAFTAGGTSTTINVTIGTATPVDASNIQLDYTAVPTPTPTPTPTPSPTPTPTPTPPGSGDGMVITNFTRSSALWNFATAAAAVVGGSAGSRCKVACVGDSTTLGVTSTSTVTTGNCYPDALASNLATIYGVPENVASWFGDQIILPDVALSGSGASWNFGLSGPGSGYLQIANVTDSATWTPSDTRLHGTFDRLDIYFYDAGSGTGPIDVTVGGNTYTVAAGPGSGNVAVSTITLSAPVTNPSNVAMKLHSGSYCFIGGMALWNHSTPSIEVYNLGIGGTTWSVVDQTVTTGISVCASIAAMAPHLAIINYGINDINQGFTLSTTEGYATTGLTTLSGISGMDLMVMLPNPFTPSGTAVFTQAQLQTGILGVCTTSPLNIPLASLHLTYGDNQTDFTGSSFMASDPHPSVAFYQDEGKRIAALLTDTAQAPYAVASPALPASVTPSGWAID